MTDPFYDEYFELLKGAREHISASHPKGSYILAEKENWEALRQAMTLSRQNEQQSRIKPAPKTPAASNPAIQRPLNTSISQVSTTPTPPPAKNLPPPSFNPTTKAPTTPTEPKRVLEEKINRSLSLAEAPPAQEVDFGTWKEIFRDKFPQIQLVEPEVCKLKTQNGIVIVFDKITPQELTFLQNLARTCHLLLGPARLLSLSDFQKYSAALSTNQIEREPEKMLLCYGVNLDGGFPVEQLSVYLQTPATKAQLWRQLSTKFMQKSS